MADTETIYECEGAGATDSDCTPADDFNEVAPLDRDNGSTLTATIPKQITDRLTMAWTTPSGEPNNAAWPTGDYNIRDVNVTAADADFVYNFLLLRVDSGCSIAETLGTSPNITLVGFKTFEIDDITPGAGAAGDRYQFQILIDNTGHSDADFSVNPGSGMPAPDLLLEWAEGVTGVAVDFSQVIGSFGAAILAPILMLWVMFFSPLLPSSLRGCQPCQQRERRVRSRISALPF